MLSYFPKTPYVSTILHGKTFGFLGNAFLRKLNYTTIYNLKIAGIGSEVSSALWRRDSKRYVASLHWIAVSLYLIRSSLLFLCVCVCVFFFSDLCFFLTILILYSILLPISFF